VPTYRCNEYQKPTIIEKTMPLNNVSTASGATN
jgi:hypothetical protein